MKESLLVVEAINYLKDFDVTVNPFNLKSDYTKEYQEQLSVYSAFNSAYEKAKEVGLVLGINDSFLSQYDFCENKNILIEMMMSYFDFLGEDMKNMTCREYWDYFNNKKDNVLIGGDLSKKISSSHFNDEKAFESFYKKFGFASRDYAKLTDVEYYIFYFKIVSVISIYFVTLTTTLN